jgi:hypothetical protein
VGEISRSFDADRIDITLEHVAQRQMNQHAKGRDEQVLARVDGTPSSAEPALALLAVHSFQRDSLCTLPVNLHDP